VSRSPADDGLLAAALDYAARGWPVLPLHHPVSFGPKAGPGRARCSCRSGSCESQGKHPRTPNGLKDATTDRAVIGRWWHRWRSANVGLVTGVVFDVLDLDGLGALKELDAVTPVPDGLDGPMALTGRGLHVLVAPTGAGNRTGMLPGVDWRGRGGYIVAAPSWHYSGERYGWCEGFGPDRPLPPCPPWLAGLARPDVAGEVSRRPAGAPRGVVVGGDEYRYGAVALDAECDVVARAVNGTRNHTLNRASFKVGQLVAGGVLDEAGAVAALLDAAGRCGLGEREASQTIASGLRAGGRSPRGAA
jgi:hypothetical protein